MNTKERWRHLCELLFAISPGVEMVGAYDRNGRVLAAVGTAEKPEDQLTAVKALAARLGSSSPLSPTRSGALSRASFTLGRRRLLMRSMPSHAGYVFIFGAPDSVTSSTWLQLDA
ncbi:MAG: hypothetical protein AAFY88_05140, partial [Acidobacteriota bacterium]